MENNLEKQIENFNSLDTFDRQQVRNGVMLQNANSREGQRIYKLAKEKGVVN